MFFGLAYTVYRDADTFVQLSPPEAGAWPVDLMLVKEATLELTLAAGIEVEMYGVQLLIPTLEHLLALKLHALKHGHFERHSKDLLDVENLLRLNKVDLRSERIRQLFLKYGTLELYGKISRACNTQ